MGEAVAGAQDREQTAAVGYAPHTGARRCPVATKTAIVFPPAQKGAARQTN